MLRDGIRALVAALLVGLLPGWFGAECLCATADRAERITYSAALSMALVPVRLLDVGVTLSLVFDYRRSLAPAANRRYSSPRSRSRYWRMALSMRSPVTRKTVRPPMPTP